MNKIIRFTLLIITPAIFLWGGYTLDYSLTEFSFYKENGYDRVRTSNFALCGEPGAPELPAACLHYIIPPNAKAESIIISQYHVTEIPGEYLIYPAQPPWVPGESIPWVPPDTLIYNSDSLFPEKYIEIVGEGIMDGARIVTVEVRPLQYRPLTRRLFLVNNIQFEFSFSSNVLPELRPQIRGIYEQEVYDAALRDVVMNDYEIPAYYQQPTLVEESQLGTLAPVPGAPGVIITPNTFVPAPAFQLYADWLTDQGIRTVCVSPEQIYANFTGVDNAEKVRNYIKWCYERAGGTWFILGGDYPYLPVRYGYSLDVPQYPYNPHLNSPCDLYFSDLTGNWNCDFPRPDSFWGELHDDRADRYPEVYVGRITPYNTTEVQNWINKVLNYEKTPQNIFTTALWISSTDIDTGDAYTQFPSFFSHVVKYDYAAYRTVDELNYGYGITNTNCHGYTDKLRTNVFEPAGNQPPPKYVHAYWDSPPNESDDGLNRLNNVNKYYPHYSIACDCGGYDPNVPPNQIVTDTCIADAFVDAYTSKGACAFLGNTRYATLAGKDLQYEFYKVLFKLTGYPVARLGYAEALSKCGARIIWEDNQPYRHTCYAHNLFGSPHTEVWTNTPGLFSVSHPTQILVGVPTQFTVTVRDGSNNNPLQYAKVCLNKPNDIYQVGETNASGQVTFTITPQTTGTIKVTVTRPHNIDVNYAQYLPSQTICRVTSGGGGQALGSGNVLPASLCIINITTIVDDKIVIKFGIPDQNEVAITIYDAAGSIVNELTGLNLKPGYHERTIDINNLSSGVYFVVLKQDDEKVAKKIILAR